MSAPPLKAKVRTCRAKVRYADEFAARAGAAGEIDSGRVARMWVYHCHECRGWHLTSHNNGRYWLVEHEALVAAGAVCLDR